MTRPTPTLDLRGVHTALVTPFAEDGSVDTTALGALVDAQVEAGISGLVPCGTTGESPTLSHHEHDGVIAFTVRRVAGRVPVIAGTGSNSTEEAVQLSRHAEMAGADAILTVNPYYNKPTQKGLYLHFKAVADAVSLPVVLYNIAGRSAVNLETATLVRLAQDCPNIVAVKEASGSLDQMKDVLARAPEGFTVLAGDDNLAVDLIGLGGHGVISVASNLLPGAMGRMVRTALEGDLGTARTLEAQLSAFFAACFSETNPIPIKTALAEYGWCRESFRLPLCTLEDEGHREQLLRALEAVDCPRGALLPA
ncbi:4-hydroxy-tetrahydrodipicolinate synthase [Kytococcus sedentarius]|uniref:4-hydroxy-tetrahydrodipicolinate synthase n=1 Tax=Kytococcus sedentarius (strain ATCC 14392 / DSM 20547 / JCM 11482 / CCUG 33030 / NBRC 15357 / NCTC 11040 / CCM 314 / 541) TaxID=478801 RepID=C7NIU8_KYTSD|nr:4-hydroxy-tetrahydrodipicolinate synthase [Kytococcus sedentarius]ACV05173.1 dihydrodipicolinate synthase [Kytococcus sedentarius DSM 20547]QQB63641.1 4-hydroxy-tetrahydrodipicolinate synthase [Kytococcus sedentarius]STX13422.1 Dihydrodipicolinate synthase [Kytococcus sedentarius]